MAPSRGLLNSDLLIKLFLVGASTFGCLLWASYIVERRTHSFLSNPKQTHNWKKLDNFVFQVSTADKLSNTLNNSGKSIIEESVIHDDSIFSDKLAIPSQYEGNIYMDWMGDSDDFDYINYKSLESLLNVYPRASITVNLIAANGAHYYKMGNLISKHYFQKYLKYGYNVQVKIVYRHFRVRFDNDTLPPGSEYWNKVFDECCESTRAVEINKYRYIPAHLYFYLRFFNLWSHGGIYSDFTWYHRTGLPGLNKLELEFEKPAQQTAPEEVILDDHRRLETDYLATAGLLSAAIVKTRCPKQQPLVSTKISAEPFKCQSSTLLAFSAGHPVLECMLLQYDTTSTPLMSCLNQSSTEVSGVLCVNQALSDCFASSNSHNTFLTYSTPGAGDLSGDTSSSSVSSSNRLPGIIKEPMCKEDAIFSCEGLKKSKDAHIKDIPTKDHSVPHWLASNRLHHQEEAHNSVHSAVNINAMCELHDHQYHAMLHKHSDNFGHTYTRNSAGHLSNSTVAGSATNPKESTQRVRPAVSDFALAYTQTYSRASAMREVYAAHTAAVWLGGEAYSGDWAAPEEGSALARFIAANPLKVPGPYYKHRLSPNSVADVRMTGASAGKEESAGQGKALRSAAAATHTIARSNSVYVPYALKSLGAVSTWEMQYLSKARRGDITHLAVADPLYKGCSKYQFDVTIPDKMKNQANVSCALHFVVPGFMKAGTTYMFGSLMSHPQLLNTLRGVTFKETGCYSSQYTQLKPWTGGTSSKAVVKLDANGAVISEYRNRMHCFPFVESHEQMFFGDGTVWYGFHPEVRTALLRDNPQLKVLFSVRNPVHRTESQHRFSYRTLLRQHNGDLNEIVHYLLDPASLVSSDGASLVELRSLALSAVEDRDLVSKQHKIDTLLKNFLKKPPRGNKKYAALNQFVKYSIYFPAVYSWMQVVPTRNIMVAPVEQLQVNRLSDPAKLEYVRNLTTVGAYSALLAVHADAVSSAERELQVLLVSHSAKQEKALGEQDAQKQLQVLAKLEQEWETKKTKINKQRNAALNGAFLAVQYNRIFRFLGLPEMERIVDADSHQTGDKDIPAHHKLNQTTRCLLTEFYRPFNALLETLLNGSVGYDGHQDDCSEKG